MLTAANAEIVTTIEAAKDLFAASDFHHIVSKVPKRGLKMREELKLQL